MAIQEIVCGYREGHLPGSWFQTYMKVKRGMERANLPVRVSLRPLNRVAQNCDLLIVPAGLAALAARPGVAEVLIVPEQGVQRMVDDLICRLSPR